MTACRFCSGTVEPEVGDDDTCETCWYGMRLEPEMFEQRMKSLGVTLKRGAHGWHQREDGSVIHVNASPYEPGPVKLVRMVTP